MDKEILRIVIIATGMVVVIGMLIWAYIKDKKAREDMEFYDDETIMPMMSSQGHQGRF